MGTTRWRWLAAIAMAGIVFVVAALWYFSDPLHARSRRLWAQDAIARIEKHVGDSAWVAAQGGHQDWGAGELITFKNGQWMVCENVCTKEENTSVGCDLFIGRGSDGVWYYSTFHFCIEKIVLKMSPQPADLNQFVQGYYLRQFDGSPLHCLEETWKGGAWGEERTERSGNLNP